MARAVDQDGHSTEYTLTDAGREVGNVVKALNYWRVRWLTPHPRRGEIDPDGLMLWIRRHVVLDALPTRRVVVAIELRRSRSRSRKRYWLVLQPGEVSLCPGHPGVPEDLMVAADVAALHRVFLGTMRLADAMDDGLVHVDGPSSLVRAIPRWFRIQ